MDAHRSSHFPQPVSTDGKLEAFDSVPLFMRSLPEDDTDDIAISALQSLAHEGTPDEIAENFKEQGNNYFKGRRYIDARSFYTQGIDAKPMEPALLDALLCNRAACNLELKNYGFVLRDCSRAISLNPHSVKAYYRSAFALIALERFDEAIDCCTRCLYFHPSNASIQMLHEQSRKGKDIQDKKEGERKERFRREAETKRQLEKAYEVRNIIPINSPNGTDNPYAPHFAADSQSSTPRLIVPVFFLYPQYATSDLISHYDEETPFSGHLDAMFPSSMGGSIVQRPQWDEHGVYIAPNLVVYAITRKKRLLKVGKKMNLIDVFHVAKGRDKEVDGLELKDGCLSVVVLPKGDIEARWVEDFKATRDQ